MIVAERFIGIRILDARRFAGSAKSARSARKHKGRGREPRHYVKGKRRARGAGDSPSQFRIVFVGSLTRKSAVSLSPTPRPGEFSLQTFLGLTPQALRGRALRALFPEPAL